MTPNKLPPLPESSVSIAVEAFLASTGQAHTVTQLQRDLTTKCMQAALEALRQSQSLPAGAVAVWTNGENSYLSPETKDRMIAAGNAAGASIGEVTFGQIAEKHATPLYTALQADAREKGEAFAGYVGDNGEFFWPDLPQGRIDKLRSEGVIVREVFYATQPAQASEAPICHAEYLSRTPQPVTPAGGEVAVYQRRTRPTFDPKHLWTPWEDCSEASFNDVKRAPVVLGWISESRALYEHPPVADAALVRTLEHCRDWFESQAKVISKGCGSSWNIVQCHEQRDLIDEVLAALNQRGGGSHA